MNTLKRKVILVFKNKKQYEEAIDFLLKLKIAFNGTTNQKFIAVSQSNYKKFDLDLYLNSLNTFSKI